MHRRSDWREGWLLCFVVLALALGGSYPPTQAQALETTSVARGDAAFWDIDGHVDEDHIRKLADMGVVSGYGNGLFGPDDPVTREQFATMLVRALGLEAGSANGYALLRFADRNEISDWASPYVAVAVEQGLVHGMSSNRFAPQEYVTRAQALTMIARATVGEEALDSIEGAYSATGFRDDVLIPDWARPAVNYALEQGIVTLEDYDWLEPSKKCTRAMGCCYLSRLVDRATDEETNEELQEAHYRWPGGTVITSLLGTDYGGPNDERPNHNGVDISSNGAPFVIYPVIAGEVLFVRTDWEEGDPTHGVSLEASTSKYKAYNIAGNHVMIRGVDGYVYRYCHMSQVWVTAGDLVGSDDPLGVAGETGLAYGVHLHLTLLKSLDGPWDDNYLDPMSVLPVPDDVDIRAPGFSPDEASTADATPGDMTVSSSKPTYSTNEDIVLSWTTSKNAVRYGLTIRKSPYTGDSSIVYNTPSLTGNSVNVGRLPPGEYRFAMRGYNASGTGGPISNIVYFTVKTVSQSGAIGQQLKTYGWTGGWSSAEFYRVGGNTYLFLLKKDNGAVHIQRMNSDGTVGPRVQTSDWTSNWTVVRPFKVGTRSFLFLLKTSDGSVHIQKLESDGTVGSRVATYDWSSGWTTAEFYTVDGNTYLFLLKKNGGAVHIHRMNSDGTVGPRVQTSDWSSNWTVVRPFYVGESAYLFLLKTADGTVHIQKLNSDGTVGARAATYDWSSGWTMAEFYSVGGKTCLLLLKENGVIHVHEMRTNGSVGPYIDERDWPSGWTSVRAFQVGGADFLFFLKQHDGTAVVHEID